MPPGQSASVVQSTAQYPVLDEPSMMLVTQPDAQPKSQRFSRDYLERFKVVMGKRCRRMEKSAQ